MTYAERRNLALILLAAFIAIVLLTGCGTTHHALPAYEPPLAKTNFNRCGRLRTRTLKLTIDSTAIATLSVENCMQRVQRFIEPKL